VSDTRPEPSGPDPAAVGPDGADPAAGADRDEWTAREEARVRGAARAVRGMFAGTLCMEAFTVALVPTVVAKFGDGLTAAKLTALLVLAGLLVVSAALLRRPWGLALASALQFAVIACGVLTGAMYALGVLFGLIWLYELRVRRELLVRRPPPAAPSG
jgi:hypothetical protein